MKKFDRVLLFFICLTGLFFSICILSLFYPIPYIHDIIVGYHQSALPWLDYVFAGYCAVLCLCFFILFLIALFFPGNTNFLILTKDKGKILFSKKTIVSTVRYSFADLDGIRFSTIKVKINKNPEKTRVFIKLSLNGTQELAALTETVQEKVVSSLRSSLGIDVQCVTIRVIEANPGNTAKKESKDVVTDKDALTEAPKDSRGEII